MAEQPDPGTRIDGYVDGGDARVVDLAALTAGRRGAGGRRRGRPAGTGKSAGTAASGTAETKQAKQAEASSALNDKRLARYNSPKALRKNKQVVGVVALLAHTKHKQIAAARGPHWLIEPDAAEMLAEASVGLVDWYMPRPNANVNPAVNAFVSAFVLVYGPRLVPDLMASFGVRFGARSTKPEVVPDSPREQAA